MKQEIAWQVIRSAYRCSADLQVLMKVLKANCTADEYKPFAFAIATVIDTINVQLTDRVVEKNPELGKRIESDIAKYGRLT